MSTGEGGYGDKKLPCGKKVNDEIMSRNKDIMIKIIYFVAIS